MDVLALSSSLQQAFLRDVLDGLSSDPPAIPARWLYDRKGAALFEAITRLPEYPVTRTETALLERHAPEIAALTGSGRVVVELGAGSAAKTPILLRAVQPSAYVPIDISRDYLEACVAHLQGLFPHLAILPVEGDFMSGIRLPAGLAGRPALGFFPGSTIGNLVPAAAVRLLRGFGQALGGEAQLLIGMDRRRDVAALLAAYDDSAGLTAAFNLNLLHRINAELNADIPVDAFRHQASWNDLKSRIEMHLEAVRAVRFSVSGQRFALAEGTRIHTENSHKYGLRDSRLLLEAAGWSPLREWTDEAEQFGLILARIEPLPAAP
jgi:L-histidine N-alpha-methyltransferase